VATALGVFFGLHWLTGLVVTGIWIAMALLFRISSLSALTAMLLAPLVFWYLQPEIAFVYATIVITIMLFWRHRTNIRDLLSGQEGRINLGSKKEPD
jgi:glycerol-3-phosphate acyltransferase PlsY